MAGAAGGRLRRDARGYPARTGGPHAYRSHHRDPQDGAPRGEHHYRNPQPRVSGPRGSDPARALEPLIGGAVKNRSGRRAWMAAIPVVLVNVVAFAGQLAYLREHLPWPLPGQVLMAVTLE